MVGIKRQRLLVGAVGSSVANGGMSVLFANEMLLLCYGRFQLFRWLAGIVGESVIFFSRSNTDVGDTYRPTGE